jgi:hypothetical protein
MSTSIATAGPNRGERSAQAMGEMMSGGFAFQEPSGRVYSKLFLDIQKIQQAIDELRLQDVVNWLSPLDFRGKQMETLGRRHPETGQWFLDLDEFRDWLSGTKKALWCYGIRMINFLDSF